MFCYSLELNLRSLLVSTFVVISATLTFGIELNCNFTNYNFIWGEVEYTCEAVEVVIEQPKVVIASIAGEHFSGRSAEDVRQLRVNKQILLFVPTGLGQAFINLKALILEGTSLTAIERSNFVDLHNLTALLLPYNELVEIPVDAFADLAEVEFLSLSLNEIKSLSENVFAGMMSLKRLHLHENRIERIGGGIFANNNKLEVIWLQGNRLKFIGAEILTPVKNVKEVFLGSNVCIHDWYPGPATLEKLIEEISERCQASDNSELTKSPSLER